VRCLSDDAIFAYLSGTAAQDAIVEIERHLASCETCCALLAETAKLMEASADVTFTGAASGPEPVAMSTDPEKRVLSRGMKLGRYEILDVIGRGGMSVVYSAHDPGLVREVAIKLVRSDVSAQRGADASKARLLREARAMARLSHPNVVAIYDVGEWNDEVFIAMELVAGKTLREWLRETKPSWRAALEAFLASGEGLAAAHETGLVHRDFKPENVLVGDDARVRVTDFGLARSARGHEDSAPGGPTTPSGVRDALATLTETGAFHGTPAYMSPEQFLGKPTDARTDEFSFCVALYEALYGQRPFEGKFSEALVRHVLQGTVRPAPLSSPVPKAMRDVLLRGLRVAPDERFPSMAALLVALREAAGAAREAPAPIAEGVPAPSPVILRSSARRRVAVGALVLVLGAGMVVAATQRNAASVSGEPSAVAMPSTIAPIVAEPPPAADPPAPRTDPPALAAANMGAAPLAAAVPAPPASAASTAPGHKKRATNDRKAKPASSGPAVAPLGDKVANPF